MWTRLNLQQKVIVLFLVPLVLLTYFSTMRVVDQLQVMRESNGVVQLAQLIRDLGAAMAALPGERKEIHQYMLANGKYPTAEWIKFQEKTDAAVDQLRQHVSALDHGQYGPVVTRRLNDLLTELDKIKGQRQAILAMQTSYDQAITYYRGISPKIFSAIAAMAQYPKDAGTATLFYQIVSIMKVADATSRERAPLREAFTNGSFKGMTEQYQELMSFSV